MGAMALNAWLRIFAWLWNTDWFGEGYKPSDTLHDEELSDHLKRDLGFIEGAEPDWAGDRAAKR
ncbi:hypothetical protein [Agrobacterium sp. SORGH_AS 787]|uniref:hypothetical protein n=1 Tax=Agrobacterium sp. SORGH_AS 787 TaxID=3041775 RepID=UPI00278293FF|nr:hypothetical protein [Rhizobium sp. SORGH_AS_0787]